MRGKGKNGDALQRLETLDTLTPEARGLLPKVKDAVLQKYPRAELYLYGSMARGEQSPESDYDVLVLTEEELTEKEKDSVRDAFYDLELAHGTVISAVFYSRSQWNRPILCASPFRRNVDKEAIRI